MSISNERMSEWLSEQMPGQLALPYWISVVCTREEKFKVYELFSE